MKQNQHTIIIAAMAFVLFVWMGKRYIRGWFPPPVKFIEATLNTIDSSKLIQISNFKGSVLIVSCYQTWCIDCARETPDLHQLVAEINSDQFKVIYISDEDTGKVNAFRQRFESGGILFAKSAVSLADWGIRSFPTTYLVNKEGKVVKTTYEGYKWLKEVKTINKLLTQ